MPFIEAAIEQAETTTLILPTDLMRFGPGSYYAWGTQLINFSQIEKKYFTVMDVIQSDPINPVYNEDDIKGYRESVTPDFPSYAGAYFPYLKSMTPYDYKSDLSNVYLDGSPLLTGADGINSYEAGLENVFKATYLSGVDFPEVNIVDTASAPDKPTITIEDNVMTIAFKTAEVGDDPPVLTTTTAAQINEVWKKEEAKYPAWKLEFTGTPVVTDPTTNVVIYNELGMWKNILPSMFPFTVTGNAATNVTDTTPTMTATIALGADNTPTLVTNDGAAIIITVAGNATPAGAIAAIDPKNPVVQLALNPDYVLPTMSVSSVDLPKNTQDNATIEDVKTFLATNYINMPPSPFMAGIYSRLDNATGVWTPPANTSPIGVTGPVVPLTNKQQEKLNVDATAGKSVNAIRSFTGKGTLVWGARTNDGNSLDWRYINVRRLFISMETDISMALEAYVFKPNVHNTWVEVKTMIESYLLGLYNQGAFAGTTPDTSYQVLIGKGETMTDEDVLNGYMRVSIRVAPVRPAEFIVLTFSQMVGQ